MWPVTKKSPKKRSGGRGPSRVKGRAASGRPSRGGKAKAAEPRFGAVTRILSLLLLVPVAAGALYGIARGGYAPRAMDAVGAQIGTLIVKSGFAVTGVTIEGREAASQNDILAAVGAVRGGPIFAFDCNAARERLTQMDRIADAEVRRLLPGLIAVRITERKPLAIWQHDGKLTLVDASGHAIAPVDPPDLDKYPHVVGIGAERNAAALIDVLSRFPKIESRVRAAVRVGDRRWNLQLDNGIEVWLPAEGVETALTELLRLDKEQGVFAREVEAIDMRFKDRWILRVPTGSSEIRPGPSRNT